MTLDAARYQALSQISTNAHQLQISTNDQRASYATAKQWIEDAIPGCFKDVDPQLLERMKLAEAIVTIYVYPTWPGEFLAYFGTTLDEAIDAMMLDKRLTEFYR